MSRVLLHVVKSYDMGPYGLTFHSRGRCAADFIALKKSIALVGFEPATYGSSGKHNNHYTTKSTNLVVDNLKRSLSYVFLQKGGFIASDC
jgi:hypothetical protein